MGGHCMQPVLVFATKTTRETRHCIDGDKRRRSGCGAVAVCMSCNELLSRA